ncbi:TetR/AcrR family transcriptional regulator [Oricola sp.]|uniref:TetR/AcrR family transcriptional regulator n=1 Tax=Oricola sp. TaxID=1979950 RepID=UPI003BA89BE4
MSSENIETRTRILEAAWKLLEDGTGSAVRMSDIAKASGISRQAVYLHFPNRAELLTAVTRHIDEVKDVEAMLVESRAAKTGLARLDAFIDAWGNYIPQIYGVANALMSMQDSDAEARQAWGNRMQAVRHGCAAAVAALEHDDALVPTLTPETATDLLWTLLSVRNWEQLTRDCGWSQEAYIDVMKALASKALVVSEFG